MTDEMKPAELVEIEGKEYVVARFVDTLNVDALSGDCRRCVFYSGSTCPRITPQRKLCGVADTLLHPAEYIKLKLKGEVL